VGFLVIAGVAGLMLAGGNEKGDPNPNNKPTTSAAFDADKVAALLKSSDTVLQKPAKWQNVPYPNMYDSTRLAFDANSITVTNDEKGNVNGVDVTARVIAGDVSINGKYMVLSFDCASHYRINHSYPLALDSPTQESFIGNIACGAAKCEILRRQEGRPVCNAAAN
jgi:hypothetical protein